ncbi:LEA type 2 family protein [Polluticoccus soli]|uniref:LEA type 2 family protein n=1 Tax=Polluticoccus soli TaxID=3034150 RepID=UPI0023E26D2C|nr:LEA type 2 family protein [Flavipsychrobacter sp. JY13-12]
MKRTVLFALLIFVGLNLISCGPPPKALTYQDVKNFRLFTLSLTPDVGMDIQFYNPNNFGLKLKDADINVFINEREIGKTTITNSFDVPANDTFLLPVRLRANLGNIFANAYSILSNKEVDVRLAGYVKAGKGIYLNVPINYRGRQRLNVLGMK